MDEAPRRPTYHHGDLRRALIEAGLDLARAGGPEAVVLREATRRAGVAPNAAYRHFADRRALLQEVRAAALSQAAHAIEAELARQPDQDDPVRLAHARLRAVGAGYLRFARSEPGLFRLAFSVPEDLRDRPSPGGVGASGLGPFQLLAAALDGLSAVGALPPERRQGAEYLAWASVHGLATLLADGPLHAVDDATASEIGRRLLDMVERGL